MTAASDKSASMRRVERDMLVRTGIEERWPFRFAHSVGELAQLTSNKTNKSVISPRATLDDNSAAVRATIATGNDKPPTIPSGEVARCRLVSAKTHARDSCERMQAIFGSAIER